MEEGSARFQRADSRILRESSGTTARTVTQRSVEHPTSAGRVSGRDAGHCTLEACAPVFPRACRTSHPVARASTRCPARLTDAGLEAAAVGLAQERDVLPGTRFVPACQHGAFLPINDLEPPAIAHDSVGLLLVGIDHGRNVEGQMGRNPNTNRGGRQASSPVRTAGDGCLP